MSSTVTLASQPPNRRDGVLSTLDVAIDGLNLAKDLCGILPAQAAFGAVSVLLTMIRVRFSHSPATNFWLTSIQGSMANDQDRVDLGLFCARVCNSLDRSLKGRRLEDLSQSGLEAIQQLTM